MAVYEEIIEEFQKEIKPLKELERDQERRKEEDNEELRRQRQYYQELKLGKTENETRNGERDGESKKSHKCKTGTSMQNYQSWSLRNFKELIWIGRDFGVSSRQKLTRQK